MKFLLIFFKNEKKKEIHTLLGVKKIFKNFRLKKKYLMPIVQTHAGLVLCSGRKMFTATTNLRQKNNFIESNARRTFTNAFSIQQLVDLKKRYKYFRLLKVDEFVFENPLLQQRWSKKDIYAYKLHSCLV